MQTEGSFTDSVFLQPKVGGWVKDAFERRRKSDALHLDDKAVRVQPCGWFFCAAVSSIHFDGFLIRRIVTHPRCQLHRHLDWPPRAGLHTLGKRTLAQSLVVQPVALSLY